MEYSELGDNIDGFGDNLGDNSGELGDNIDGLEDNIGDNIDELGDNIDGLGNNLGDKIDELGDNIDAFGNNLGDDIDGCQCKIITLFKMLCSAFAMNKYNSRLIQLMIVIYIEFRNMEYTFHINITLCCHLIDTVLKIPFKTFVFLSLVLL